MASGPQIIRDYTNEFSLTATIYSSCLNSVISSIDSSPTSEEVLDIVSVYFYNTYFLGRSEESILRESINVINTRALNHSIDFLEYLDTLKISEETKELVKKIYLFPLNFQKYVYTSDKNIFNYNYEANGSINELLEEIQNAKIPVDQKILPQIAVDRLCKFKQ